MMKQRAKILRKEDNDMNKGMDFLQALEKLAEKCDALGDMKAGMIRRPHHVSRDGKISAFRVADYSSGYGLSGRNNLNIEDYLATDWEWQPEQGED